MAISNTKQKRAIFLGLMIIVMGGFFALYTYAANAQTDGDTASSDPDISGLNSQIDEKRQELDELKKKAELYENNVKGKQQEATTLENQLSIIDIQVERTQNDIETVSTEIEALNLELEKLNAEIETKTAEVEQSKETLSEFLRLISRYDDRTYLEIIMSNQSFSDFFDSFQYAQDLQEKVEQALKSTKEAKEALETQETEKSAKKDELTDLSAKLAQSVTDLGDQKSYKSTLLEQTQEDEETYQLLLEQAKQEQLAAESEVSALESKARAELEGEGIDLNVETQFIWPVAPLRGISAYFHDPSYPFRYLFEHPAIDIPSPQGTAIRAADNGYVVRAKNGGMGYSYIMIVHNNELSTVYGHVSRIDVSEEQYVVRGQVIGAIGGLPGTPGAGPLTTGSHLHFEVRSGGIPVNPLDYLPGF